MPNIDLNNREFLLNRYKDIVKIGTEYTLQLPYYETKDGHIEEMKESIDNPNKNDMTKDCSICIYNDNGNCKIRTKLENLPRNHFIPVYWNCKCDAYTPIQELTIIHSIDEMINFIENTANFFSCPEDYENYYGFQRNWDEETGDILETVREYYNRGGEFTEIPNKYPCVVYFASADLDNSGYGHYKLKWISINEK